MALTFIKKSLSTFLGLSTLLLANHAYASDLAHYAIIIDAGSSGSRLHLFEYTADQSVPDIKDHFSDAKDSPDIIKPALATYASDPAKAGPSFKPLLDQAIADLEKRGVDDPSEVPISILGTAGMRLLTHDEQKAIYDNVRDYINTYYHYTFNIKAIETMPSIMEGVYDWLDVNYLSKTFENHTHTSFSFGSLDMGGASTQIAFNNTTDKTDSDHEVPITLNGRIYHIHSNSYLGLGQDQARAAMANNTSCYPRGYQSDDAFDYKNCTDAYSEVINTNHDKVDNKWIPQDQTFIAFSGAYYDYDFFKVTENPQKGLVESAITGICSESWADLKIHYPKEPDSYLANYCANGTYVTNLFYNPNYYNLQDGHLQVVNKIEQKNIDWTLGALLYDLTVNSSKNQVFT